MTDVPELWWSPSKALETTDLLGGLSWRYVSPGGFETPTHLRNDAVRLVAATELDRTLTLMERMANLLKRQALAVTAALLDSLTRDELKAIQDELKAIGREMRDD